MGAAMSKLGGRMDGHEVYRLLVRLLEPNAGQPETLEMTGEPELR